MSVTNNSHDLLQNWDEIIKKYNITNAPSELLDFIEWLKCNYEAPKPK